jgi:hypothetical protein
LLPGEADVTEKALGIESYAEAIGYRTSGAVKYSGIRATLSLPARGDVGAVDTGTAAYHYFNFYLGFDDIAEAGVSYSKKYDPSGSWRQFLNRAGAGVPSLPSSVGFRQQLRLELTTDAKREASLTINGQVIAQRASNVWAGQAKLVFAVADWVKKGAMHQVWFDQTRFSAIELRPEGQDTWYAADVSKFVSNYVRPQNRSPCMQQSAPLSVGIRKP